MAKSRKAQTEAEEMSRISEEEASISQQLQIFLDEWYYRVLHSSIAKDTSRWDALRALLDMFEMVGVKFPPGDKDRIAGMKDEAEVISNILIGMPNGLRKQWDAVNLQLQSIVRATTRLREASEVKGLDADETVAAVFEESPADKIMQQILKGAVVSSAENVKKLRRVHVTWKKNTESRMARMMRMREEADVQAEQLEALESQLATVMDNQKSGAKAMMMKMAHGLDDALKHNTLSSWRGVVLKAQGELETRRGFEERVISAESKFLEYKASQVESTRMLMLRLCGSENEAALRNTWALWVAEVRMSKADGESAEALKKVQAKLAGFAETSAANAKKVMTRLAGNHAGMLAQQCFQAWLDVQRLSRQDKELEDAVKQAELALKKKLENKKNEARLVMERITGSCESGLVKKIMLHWVQYVHEEKDAAKMQALNAQADKLKLMVKNQGIGAFNVQTRVNDQVSANLQQRVFSTWVLETKVNGIHHVFHNRYSCKKRQLQGVQNLFKSFAMQLEQNLGGDDELNESMTNFRAAASVPLSGAQSKRSGKHRDNRDNRDRDRDRGDQRGMVRDSAGSCSLPNIHARSGEQLLV